MPTTESIDLPDRLEEMAAALIRQRADPALGAFDAVDLKISENRMRKMEGDIAELVTENQRLRGVILDGVAGIRQDVQPEMYATGGDR